MFDHDREVEPFTGNRPADVELSLGRLHPVVGTVVNVVVIFGVGRIHPLVHSKFVEISPVGGVQSSAAVVHGIRIVIGDTFSAQIIVGTLHPTGNFLRSAVIHAVLVGFALLSFAFSGSPSGEI